MKKLDYGLPELTALVEVIRSHTIDEWADTEDDYLFAYMRDVVSGNNDSLAKAYTAIINNRQLGNINRDLNQKIYIDRDEGDILLVDSAFKCMEICRLLKLEPFVQSKNKILDYGKHLDFSELPDPLRSLTPEISMYRLALSTVWPNLFFEFVHNKRYQARLEWVANHLKKERCNNLLMLSGWAHSYTDYKKLDNFPAFHGLMEILQVSEIFQDIYLVLADNGHKVDEYIEEIISKRQSTK